MDKIRIAGAVAFVICHTAAMSQNGIKLTSFVTGLTIPVDITHAGDERLFVVEKTGRIRIIDKGRLLAEPFLDIIAKVNARGNEQGLLGLAFDPEYKKNGYFYLNYINRNTPSQTVIARYKVSADSNKADATSEKILLTVNQPFANHNGGCLKFGKDGLLYIALGDGGSAGDPQNHGQNPKSLLGKILRMDVRGPSGFSVPPNNPFVNDTSTLPQIWSLGWRNPWRFSFDKLTGDMWIGDVGQGDWEEIDFEPFGDPGGKNYGWRCYEGKHAFNTTGCKAQNKYTFPLHEYFSEETINGCSVTGGFVYRGNPQSYLYGHYIYGDYCSGKIWALKRVSDTGYTNVQLFDFNNNSISSFGEDVHGELYFSFPAQGAVYKISDTCTLNVKLEYEHPLCDNVASGTASVKVPDQGRYSVRWSTGDTVLHLSRLGAGRYHVEVSRGPCKYFQEFTLNGKTLPPACISGPDLIAICQGDSVLLLACGAEENYQWYKDSVEIHGANTQDIRVFEEGSYQVQLVDSAGCRSAISEPVYIRVHALPQTPVLSIDGDTLKTAAGFMRYEWFKNDEPYDTSETHSIVVNEKAYYRVQVIDSNGCRSARSDSVYFIPTFLQETAGSLQCDWAYHEPSGDLTVYCGLGTDDYPKHYAVYTSQGLNVGCGAVASQRTISLEGLPSGLYFVTMQGRSFAQVIKLVKR